MLSNKRKRQDAENLRQEREQDRKRTATKVSKARAVGQLNLTATQAVEEFGRHAKALHTLATTGDRRDDRQHEKEGYNLLIMRQSLMGHGSHVWKPGDSDMSLLPSHVSSVYDTTGWVCINFFADNDRVVFKRPHPPLPVRGSGAQLRKVLFRFNVGIRVKATCKELVLIRSFVYAAQLRLDERDGQMVRRQDINV